MPMKYFTPDLLASYQSEDNDVADKADRMWEGAIIEYLKSFRGSPAYRKTPGINKLFLLCLHDAVIAPVIYNDPDVRIMAKVGDTTYMITYTLTKPPVWSTDNVPEALTWLYEELEIAPVGYIHRILFNSDVVLELYFSHVKVSAITNS